MDQTQRPRYVSRFEHLTLHPRLHHRVGFPIHYLPPREPQPRRIYYNNGVPNSSLKQPPHNRGVGPQPNNNQHLYRRGLQPNSNSTSPRGSKQQSPPLPKREQTPTQYNNLNLYQRGSNTRNQGFTTSGMSQPQTSFLFPQNNDPNRLGQRIAQM